jgi:hypothetical protein
MCTKEVTEMGFRCPVAEAVEMGWQIPDSESMILGIRSNSDLSPATYSLYGKKQLLNPFESNP